MKRIVAIIIAIITLVSVSSAFAIDNGPSFIASGDIDFLELILSCEKMDISEMSSALGLLDLKTSNNRKIIATIVSGITTIIIWEENGSRVAHLVGNPFDFDGIEIPTSREGTFAFSVTKLEDGKVHIDIVKM